MSEPWPVVDLRALPEGAEVSSDEAAFREFCRAIVMAATARLKPVAEKSTVVPCGASPDSETCNGWIHTRLEAGESELAWWCDRCEQRGLLTGWAESPVDLSNIAFPGARKSGVWLELELSQSEHDALLGVEFHDEVITRLLHSVRKGEKRVLLRAPRLALRHLLENMAIAATHAETRSDWDLFDAVFADLERLLGK